MYMTQNCYYGAPDAETLHGEAANTLDANSKLVRSMYVVLALVGAS